MISDKQIKLIHIALKQLGIGEPEYRAILGREYDANSSKDLSYEQASALIDSLKERGFRIKPRRRLPRPKGNNIINMVSRQELAKLEHLRADVRWRHHNGYFRLMKKVIGKDRITTSTEASKMIECLKAMLKRQNKASAVEPVGEQF